MVIVVMNKILKEQVIQSIQLGSLFYFLAFILAFSAALTLMFNFSSSPRRSVSSLYLFLIVTSVIPATSATSLCVFFSSLRRAATYSAAAAIPAGPLPEVNSETSAFFSIFSASF